MFRKRHIQVKLVKDDKGYQTENRVERVVILNFNDASFWTYYTAERIGKLTVGLYAAKRAVDLIAQSAEHILVTKVK